jgi:hypothetical protein
MPPRAEIMADTIHPTTPAEGSGEDADLAVLLQRYMDSALSEAELAGLDDLLRNNRAARAEFIRGLMHTAFLKELVAQERSAASLSEMLGEESSSPDDAEPQKKAQVPLVRPLADPGVETPLFSDSIGALPSPGAPLAPLPSPLGQPDGFSHDGSLSSPNWKLFGTLGAFALLIFFVVLAWPNRNENPVAKKESPLVPTVVAELVKQRNCVWLIDGQTANPSKLKTGSTVQLQQGEAELKIGKGVHVTLQGPVTFQPATADRLVLIDGPVTAHVPAAAVGFMVDAPSIRVTDLGTEFGVKSFPDGHCVLHVFQGSVQVELGDGTGKKRVVRAGQSIGARTELVRNKLQFHFDESIPVDSATFLRSVSAGDKNSPKGM